MARLAFSSQCWFITIMVVLTVFAAFIGFSFKPDASNSAKFRLSRDAEAASSAALLDDDSFEHSSNVSHGLTKRGMAPRCSVDTAFVSVERGSKLTDWMLLTHQSFFAQFGAAGVGKLTFPDAIGGSSGWKKVTEDSNFNPRPYSDPLLGLDNVEYFQTNVRVSLVGQPWVRSTYDQSKPYIRVINGVDTMHPPTHARHVQISSVWKDTGVLIALESYDAALMSSLATGQPLPADDLPEVNLWSSLAFIEYGRAGKFRSWAPVDSTPAGRVEDSGSRKRQPPRWIYIPQLRGPIASLELVSHCVFSWGLWDLPNFANRITFPIGSFCFEAILGLPQGTALAFFLIDHKFRFGAKTLASVTIWGSGVIGQDGYELPSMLWWTADHRLKTTHWAIRVISIPEIRSENAAYILEAGWHPTTMPFMLRPRY